MPEPRIVPPEDVNRLRESASARELWAAASDLARTAAVLGEQRAAALVLHVQRNDGHGPLCDEDDREWPCPTARALGVTE